MYLLLSPKKENSKKNLILGLKKQFSSYFLLSISFLEKRIGLSKTKIKEKNLSSISERQDGSQKKILILGLRKQFSSTFLPPIAFLEKRIGLTETKFEEKTKIGVISKMYVFFDRTHLGFPRIKFMFKYISKMFCLSKSHVGFSFRGKIKLKDISVRS